MKIPVNDHRFWKRYLPWAPETLAPFKMLSFQIFEVPGERQPRKVRSMLSGVEVALLYALAKDEWTGAGEIVDLGCFYGFTTWCLASGMRANQSVGEAAKLNRLYAYDLFLTDGYEKWIDGGETVHTGSIFKDFLNLNGEHTDYVVPCPGNLLQMQWGSKPIEILHIDAAKDWTLNGWIVSKMFPALIPGTSIVLQQDYIHYYEYWVIITMEYFKDKFKHIYTIFGSTAAFRCIEQITETEACVELSKLTLDDQCRLMLSAMSKQSASAQEVMKTAYAKLLIDNDKLDDAEDVLNNTRDDITDEIELNFSGIAKSNKEAVLNILRLRRQATAA